MTIQQKEEKMQSIILDKMETGKSYEMSHFTKDKAKEYNDLIFKAWQDMKANGRISQTKTGWRKNN